MKGTKRILQIIWFLALLAIPIVLWILPADYFDHGGASLCPSKRFFDIECFGCGMTRAFMHFHHFEFTDAIFFNWGVLWAFPLISWIWILWVMRAAIRLDYISFYNSKSDLFRRIHKHAKAGYNLPMQ